MELSKITLQQALCNITPLLDSQESKVRMAKIAEMTGKCREAQVCILVCGEFKRGKSTFINALTGRDLCATDTDICTSAVSVIRYGETEKVIRYFGDIADPESETIEPKDLEKYTVGAAETIENTIFVDISLPLPILKEGIVIIDTPGVGGLDPRHAAITNMFMPRADVALFLTDVNETMSDTELEFLKNNVVPNARRTALIVNKTDLLPAEDVNAYIEDSLAKINAQDQLAEHDIPVVAVSAAAEAYPDWDLGDSNFGELKKVIKGLVDEHRTGLIESLRKEAVDMLDALIAPVETQLRTAVPDTQTLSSLNQQKLSLDSQLADLSDPASPFRMAVAREISAKKEEILNYLNEASVELQSEKFPGLLRSPEAAQEDGGKWLGRKLNDEIARIGSELVLKLNQAFESIAALPQFGNMLSYTAHDFGNQVTVKKVDTSVPLNKRLTPLMSGAGIITLGCFYVATGPIGIAAFIGIGAYVSYKNQQDSSSAYVESTLRQAYQSQLASVVNSMNTYVGVRFSEFQQELLSAVSLRCSECRKSMQECIENMRRTQQSASYSAASRSQAEKKLKILLSAKDLIMNAPI